MKIGDAIYIPQGTVITLTSCGIPATTTFGKTVEVAGLTEDEVLLFEDGMTKSIPRAQARLLPCTWIIGQEDNTPMALLNALQAPLKALGVEALYVPMSQIRGLWNAPDDLDKQVVVEIVRILFPGRVW